jgi:hypothetical protein
LARGYPQSVALTNLILHFESPCHGLQVGSRLDCLAVGLALAELQRVRGIAQSSFGIGYLLFGGVVCLSRWKHQCQLQIARWRWSQVGQHYRSSRLLKGHLMLCFPRLYKFPGVGVVSTLPMPNVIEDEFHQRGAQCHWIRWVMC